MEKFLSFFSICHRDLIIADCLQISLGHHFGCILIFTLHQGPSHVFFFPLSVSEENKGKRSKSLFLVYTSGCSCLPHAAVFLCFSVLSIPTATDGESADAGELETELCTAEEEPRPSDCDACTAGEEIARPDAVHVQLKRKPLTQLRCMYSAREDPRVQSGVYVQLKRWSEGGVLTRMRRGGSLRVFFLLRDLLFKRPR